MLTSYLRALIAGVALTLWISGAFAQAQFPGRPVTLLVPYGPGGSADVLARALADRLASVWNVPVIVENRTGANGIVATESLIRAQADGHTILMHLTAVIQNASLYKKLPYDPFDDLVPVTQIGTQPMGLAVNPKSPHHDVKSLVAALSAAKDKGSYGSFGAGSTGHIFGELLRSAAGSSMPHLAFRGEAPLIPEIMTGRVELGFVSAATAAERGTDGSLRILAVTGTRRLQALPNVPTMAEAGLHGFDLVGWYGLFVPRGTSPAVVQRIAISTRGILFRPEMAIRLQQLAIDPIGSTPQQFKETMREDHRRWEQLIKTSKITLD